MGHTPFQVDSVALRQGNRVLVHRPNGTASLSPGRQAWVFGIPSPWRLKGAYAVPSGRKSNRDPSTRPAGPG